MGTGQALSNLHRIFLYHLPSMGTPMLGVFRGRLQSDTLRHGGDSGSTPVVLRRFFLTDVDTLRVWVGNECADAKLPRE